MKAMILAAGMGTRLKPFTDKHPKALASVNGKTLLERNIMYLNKYGVEEIVINVHHFSNQVTDFLTSNKNFGINIKISDESNEVLETGGGLKKAGKFFTDESTPFILMNVDVLTDLDLEDMLDFHNGSKAFVTLAVTQRNTSRYFLFDDVDRLCGWKNIKTHEQKISRSAQEFFPKAFSGIHIISPEIFSELNIEGKFSIVDVYLSLADTKKILGYDHTHTKFIDVGKPGSIAIAEKMFRR